VSILEEARGSKVYTQIGLTSFRARPSFRLPFDKRGSFGRSVEKTGGKDSSGPFTLRRSKEGCAIRVQLGINQRIIFEIICLINQ
jgi:hypothetical protein